MSTKSTNKENYNVHASLPVQFPIRYALVRTSAILFGESEVRQPAKARWGSVFAAEVVEVVFAAERRQVASAVVTGASWKTTGWDFGSEGSDLSKGVEE
jgi:hypothetical protein